MGSNRPVVTSIPLGVIIDLVATLAWANQVPIERGTDEDDIDQRRRSARDWLVGVLREHAEAFDDNGAAFLAMLLEKSDCDP